MTNEQEKRVLDNLVAAWNEFYALCREQPSHPDDLTEFKQGIHTCQMVISHRVAKRADPETWGK